MVLRLGFCFAIPIEKNDGSVEQHLLENKGALPWYRNSGENWT